ncbi:MAG TPA: formate dehydrogenase N subunit beta transmembrane domain-containing protein, partial [Mycoplana sp.]|nr:formate dehydrogenase N subunit beta transmembrane domain-containing protein [Mycoplana sp.]
VEVWKGATKYAGMAVMGLAAAGGLLHYLFRGPNVVTEHDEEQAERLTGDERS